jgi:hypothetical protein
LQQDANPEVIDAGVVADDGEVLRALAADGGDEIFRDASKAKAAHEDGGAIGEVGDSDVGGVDALIQERVLGERESLLQDGTERRKEVRR